MYQAGLRVVEDGFIPWTLSECFEWFEGRSEKREPTLRSRLSVPWATSAVRRII